MNEDSLIFAALNALKDIYAYSLLDPSEWNFEDSINGLKTALSDILEESEIEKELKEVRKSIK